MVSGNGSGSGVGWRRLAGVIASAATLLSMGAIVPSAMADDGLTLDDVVAADAAGGVRAASSFVDVNAQTPHAENIAWLASSGVSTGWTRADGRKEFRPTLSVTRQDMAAFLYRVAGNPAFDESRAANPFKDVNAKTPHYKEVLWLASSGISTGWPDGTFRGMDTVKRQDMAAFLHRLAVLQKANPKLGATMSFKDVTASTPHQADIVWLARTGVTTGWKDGTFRGMTAVIRQDMAAFLQRTHDNVLHTDHRQAEPTGKYRNARLQETIWLDYDPVEIHTQSLFNVKIRLYDKSYDGKTLTLTAIDAGGTSLSLTYDAASDTLTDTHNGFVYGKIG